MSEFLIYEYSSGEIVFIKRSAIGSFHPRYVQKNCYRVFVTVGKESYVIYETDSLESAKNWIREQISLIEGEDSDGRKDPSASEMLGARIAGIPANKS